MGHDRAGDEKSLIGELDDFAKIFREQVEAVEKTHNKIVSDFHSFEKVTHEPVVSASKIKELLDSLYTGVVTYRTGLYEMLKRVDHAKMTLKTAEEQGFIEPDKNRKR